MFNSTFFLLTCSVFLAVTLGQSPPKKPRVPGVDLQCKARGYYGACYDWLPQENWISNPETCRMLKCAERFKTRPYIRPVLTGAALNGTICGKSKICLGGSCVEVKRKEIPINKGRGYKWICSDPVPVSLIINNDIEP